MPDYIADDYAFIAKRLREIEGSNGPRKWAIWYTEALNAKGVWLRVSDSGTAHRATESAPATLFDTEAEAQLTIRHLNSTTRDRCQARPYVSRSEVDL